MRSRKYARYLLICCVFLILSCLYTKQISHPDFLICNEEIDMIQEEYTVKKVFTGIKDDFYVNQDIAITFVSHWEGKKGLEAKLKIYEPDGDLYTVAAAKLKYDKTCWFGGYFVKRLHEDGGTGRWIAKWYLKDNLVEKITFTIRN